MTTRRQRFIDEMEVRGLSRHTKEFYVGFVSRLSRHYRRAPDKLSEDELKAYLLHLLREKKNGRGTLSIGQRAAV
ncbi:MAG: phage integrase N-terminal SAM-like domain-containing protein [Sulfuricaulis sp.]|nr:phage integrase N-terminal SAM-like domain-containing protein [Sulfuricaulis sp.]